MSNNTKLPEGLERDLLRTLSLHTFETRHSDQLDFSDQAIWILQKAVEQAYAQGFKDGRSKDPDGHPYAKRICRTMREGSKFRPAVIEDGEVIWAGELYQDRETAMEVARDNRTV